MAQITKKNRTGHNSRRLNLILIVLLYACCYLYFLYVTFTHSCSRSSSLRIKTTL